MPRQAGAGGTAAGGVPIVATEKILGSPRQAEVAADHVAAWTAEGIAAWAESIVVEGVEDIPLVAEGDEDIPLVAEGDEGIPEAAPATVLQAAVGAEVRGFPTAPLVVAQGRLPGRTPKGAVEAHPATEGLCVCFFCCQPAVVG